MKWISVEDRLPEDSRWIIGMNVDECVWLEQWDEQESIGFMTHWIYAPTPPAK
jgi:hypothetical protein